MRCAAIVVMLLTACTAPTVFIEKAGDGRGTVGSDPAGIDCGILCGNEMRGTVTLSATPAPYSVFTGWSGDCHGDTCVLDMTTDYAVVATFELTDVPLTLDAGGGSIRVETPDWYCMGECTRSFKYGARLVMRATAPDGYGLAGWGDALECSGDTCVLDLVEPRRIAAEFVRDPILTITTNGSGTVTARGAAISGTSEPVSYKLGSEATLTANAGFGVFAGWGGACAGVTSDVCVLTMDQNRSVTANFIPPTLDRPCTTFVSASESATAFNARLVANAVVCLQGGVTISGPVEIHAKNVVVRGIGAAGQMHLIAMHADAVTSDGFNVGLQNLDIATLGNSNIAVNALGGTLSIADSTVRCNTTGCYGLTGDNSTSVKIERSSIVAVTGMSLGAAFHNAAHLDCIDSTIDAPLESILVTTGATLSVTGSTLRSRSDNGAVRFNWSGGGTIESSQLVSGYRALSFYGGGSGPSTLTLDNNAFRRLAGGAAVSSSPIYINDVETTVNATAPSSFCNEGTSTTDGEWIAPLLEGNYAAGSTFNSVAHAGPSNCP